MFEPAYLQTFESGRLHDKVQKALGLLTSCTVCPRDCQINRMEDNHAICRTGRYARIASYFPHFGEEACLRGWNGSGTIFFSNCNLKCVFCQNWDISQRSRGTIMPPKKLAAIMLELQSSGCHNINFVTPEHVVPQILEGLLLAVAQGLHVPLVYNTGSYDSMDSIRLMDGVVDIYMPDFKFWHNAKARKFLKAEDYPQTARMVIKEMHRQVGDLIIDSDGLTRKGVLIRHLVMPGDLDGTQAIMNWVAQEISPYTFVNLMNQYRPAYKTSRYPEINLASTGKQYLNALAVSQQAGLSRLARNSES